MRSQEPSIDPSRDRKGAESEHPSLMVGARNPNGARNAVPLACHIVLSCYGARLHGDEAGSVDRDHNLPGTEYLPSNPQRAQSDFDRIAQPAYEMDGLRRKVVLEAIREVCIYRHWDLLAAHVRTTHIHAVVKALVVPERILNDFKSYSSRRLNESGFDQPGRKRWSHHGSTRYLGSRSRFWRQFSTCLRHKARRWKFIPSKLPGESWPQPSGGGNWQ